MDGRRIAIVHGCDPAATEVLTLTLELLGWSVSPEDAATVSGPPVSLAFLGYAAAGFDDASVRGSKTMTVIVGDEGALALRTAAGDPARQLSTPISIALLEELIVDASGPPPEAN